jgi:hypothetical protein
MIFKLLIKPEYDKTLPNLKQYKETKDGHTAISLPSQG